MDKYIGTKLIEAKEMNLGDYNNYRGWKIPKNENPNREGYLVEYSDGYISWSPKEIFEQAYNKLNMTSDIPEILEHKLITKENTYISHDESVFNAPHNYLIHSTKSEQGYDILAGIHFQQGAVKETSLNGVFMEDLIAICINRLEHFQNSNFKCDENKDAIKYLEHALVTLRKRTDDRIKRNVQGQYKI